MARSKGVLAVFAGVIVFLSLAVQSGITAQAGSKNYLNDLNGGGNHFAHVIG